ncbi:MAG TPA: hypothetical protein VMJ93_03375 [Verrucomicrobiae bacterium]|nr:hypothetical protein [Verrucomicrobiae bacterium]
MTFAYRHRLAAGFSALLIATPLFAYVYPLTPGQIRDAYLAGSETGASADGFFASYGREIPELQVDGYVSRIRISTPYAEIARAAQGNVNHDVPAAVSEYFGKNMKFRVDALIFYLEPQSGSPDVRISVFQKGKEIRMEEEKEREPQMPYDSPPSGYVAGTSAGEEVFLACEASKISSDPLKIVIDTPAGRPVGYAQLLDAGSPVATGLHAEITFDLSRLK